MTTPTHITPPDDRLDGPVHAYFGLTYSNYLVLHRTLMQSMPEEWQNRMVACLNELDRAYAHIVHAAAYEVTAATEREYGCLSEAELRVLGVTAEYTHDSARYYDRDGDEHESWHRVLVPQPGGDPVPHYDRGRTYLPPRESHVEPAAEGDALRDATPPGGWPPSGRPVAGWHLCAACDDSITPGEHIYDNGDGNVRCAVCEVKRAAVVTVELPGASR